MIAARQISRPVANRILAYSKDHPVLRKRVLIPLGRGLAHLTTRVRMKNLGLGSPSTLAPVSEETALEQASEFMQQVVIFGYSVGVFATYYFYTKYTASEIVKAEAFNKFKNESMEKLEDLDKRLDRIELLLLKSVVTKNGVKDGNSSAALKINAEELKSLREAHKHLLTEDFSRVVLPGREQYLVMRREDTVVIEPLDNVILRGAPFAMRNPAFKLQGRKNSDKSS